MKNLRTENAVVAQMVYDAIRNDPRSPERLPSGYVLERARVWYDRLLKMKDDNRLCSNSMADHDFQEFLCLNDEWARILDFWTGDIVDKVHGDEKVKTGVVKSTRVASTFRGDSNACVLFPDGNYEDICWVYLRHSRIPQELVDIAKTQFMATHSCPLMKEHNENQEDENV